MEANQNIKETVPFLPVLDMQKSLDFYVNGLGFEIQYQWVSKDRIMWCKLINGNGSIMLQEHHQMPVETIKEKGNAGIGMSIYFICENALKIYKEIIDKGIAASEPFVGNSMWATSVNDPDGYSINFESMTDVAEGTRFSEWAK